MKFSKLLVALRTIALVGLIGLTGCSDEGGEPTPGSDITLTANAGVDQMVELGDEVTLDGSASTASDGSAFEYLWEITSAPDGSTATLTNPESATPMVSPDVMGTYRIMLTISNGVVEDTDEVEVNASIQDIGGVIDTDTRLSDVFADPNMPDYIATSEVTLRAQLTIDAGVVIYFDENVQLKIEDGGVLDANGLASNKIALTSSNVDGGQYWKGIFVQSSDQRNSLEYTEVSYAGNSNMSFASGTDYPTNVGLDDGGFMNIKNSSLSNGLGYGLFIHDDESDLGDFMNNAFENNMTGIGLNAYHVSKLDMNTTFANNANHKVQILGSTLANTETVTWNALNAGGAYYVSGDIQVKGNLAITEGARFEMAEDVLIYVAENAQFVASGSSGNEIIFTSSNIDGGIKWQALAFRSSNTNNLLNYVEVSHAGNSVYPFGSGTDYKVNVGVDNGGFVNITNSTLSNGDGYGILVHDNESDLGDFSSNTISNNQTGAGLLANHVASLDGTTVFSGNTKQVEIFGSTLDAAKTVTWNALQGSSKYTITGDLGIDGDLTIAAGAYFESKEDIFIRVDGSIDANGSSGNEITFSSTDGVKWQGLFISSSNAANSLDYVIISRAGFTEMGFPGPNYKCNLGIDDNSFLSLTNSTLSDSDGYGLAIDAGATYNAFQDAGANNTFSGNTLGPVFFE